MKKLLISACSLILMAGCISDDRENFMVDDSFTLTNRQTLVGCSVHTGTYTVGVSKNGKGTSAATATLSTSAADAIASYNEANGTSFTALPEDSFTLSASSLEFAESDVVKEVTVTWDADKIAGIIGDSKNYVIPIRITSGGGIEANPDKSLVIIQLIRSSISIMQSNMSRSISRKSVEPDSLHTADSLTYYNLRKIAPQNVTIERYGLEYGLMDNRYQTVDVNQLILGMDDCEPLQLLAMFRYCRSTSIVTRATRVGGGVIDVATELNADRSVRRMVVKDSTKNTEVTYDFEY